MRDIYCALCGKEITYETQCDVDGDYVCIDCYEKCDQLTFPKVYSIIYT